jgi:predicted O-methyltransferase YrrM
MSIPPPLGYEFTVDWFSRCIPVWNDIVPRFKPKRILEIGSYEGRSTCYLIEKFGGAGGLEIHCVGTWEGGVEHDKTSMPGVERRFDNNVAFAKKTIGKPVEIKKHKRHSSLALAELITFGQVQKFDVVYIDGSHQAADVLTDCVLSFQLLRVNGLMIFDDYIWTNEATGKQDAFNLPKPAIDAFLNIFQRKMRLFENVPLYQLYAVKTGP